LVIVVGDAVVVAGIDKGQPLPVVRNGSVSPGAITACQFAPGHSCPLRAQKLTMWHLRPLCTRGTAARSCATGWSWPPLARWPGRSVQHLDGQCFPARVGWSLVNSGTVFRSHQQAWGCENNRAALMKANKGVGVGGSFLRLERGVIRSPSQRPADGHLDRAWRTVPSAKQDNRPSLQAPPTHEATCPAPSGCYGYMSVRTGVLHHPALFSRPTQQMESLLRGCANRRVGSCNA